MQPEEKQNLTPEMEQELESEKTEFTAYIAQIMRDNHCTTKIIPLETIAKKWRFTTPYSVEFEDLIILKARVFIMTRPNKDPNFLYELCKWIARYLASYIMKAPRYKDLRDDENNKEHKDFSAARYDLIKQLFYSFQYIRDITQPEKEKQTRKKRKRTNLAARKEESKKLGAGFACRVTADGTIYAQHMTQKGKAIVPADKTLLKQVIENSVKKH